MLFNLIIVLILLVIFFRLGTTLFIGQEMAQYRIENPTLPVGGAQCPALEYTFSGSTDGGQSWEHPTASHY